MVLHYIYYYFELFYRAELTALPEMELSTCVSLDHLYSYYKCFESEILEILGQGFL